MAELDPPRICAHFGECGGCQHQDLDYGAQLSLKQSELERIFGRFHDAPIIVDPSPAIWNYRNKVDFSFGPKQYPEKPPAGFVRGTVLGFNKPGKWYWPFDVGVCLIGPEGNEALLESLRTWYRSEELRAYDSRTHEGQLRVLLVRDAKRTGQRMVVVVTSPGEFPAASFVEAVQSVFPATSIWRGTFSRSARVAEAEAMELLHGTETIEEELHVETARGTMRQRFRISPFSFFQVNTLAAERLYARIRSWVAVIRPSILYDLYGGSGGIALSSADLVSAVRSVESVPEATRDGIANAERNGIDRVYFETERVEKYLQRLLESGGFEPGSAVIVDPPRSGMVPKALRRLVELGPEHLMYVSCKPEQTALELETLLQRYRVESIGAVDLFPHTRHVEAVVALKRRNGGRL